MGTIDTRIPQLDRLVLGMRIIQKYEADPFPLAAEHDVIYCGAYATREQMTAAERDLMDVYGWREESGSWRFFV